MARAPPPKRMSVDASFHDCEPSIKFDGTNFEDFQFATLAALSAYPAAAAIIAGSLTRPLITDAQLLLPDKSGTTQLRAFMTNDETFSTGVIAISLPPSAAQYATVCSAGTFNSPWMGDNFDRAAAEADYKAFELDRKAQYVADNDGDADGYVPVIKNAYIIGAIDGRLDVERETAISGCGRRSGMHVTPSSTAPS